MVAPVEVRQEERCQIVFCRKDQDLSSGKKFVLKPGDVVRVGRGAANEIVLDYEGVSKHHADVFLREKQPEEEILGADTGLLGLLSIRDNGSKNGVAVRRLPVEQDSTPMLNTFERLVQGSTQVMQDGCSLLVPAKSRQGHKQMSVEDRMMTMHVSSIMVDVPVPQPIAPPPVVRPAVPPPVQAQQLQDKRAEALKSKKKKKPKIGGPGEFAPEVTPPTGIRLATPGGSSEVWPPPLPRADAPGSSHQEAAGGEGGGGVPEGADMSDPEGQDLPPPPVTAAAIPAKANKPPPGPGQRLLTSPRPERRRQDGGVPRSVEVLSDEEHAIPRLTQENVARVSAAAAAAAGAQEPPKQDDLELGSISDISTPGVFPWQQQSGKKAGKKKGRGESPASGEGPRKKRKKGEGGKAGKAKKPLLTAGSGGMQWDPYMEREVSPSPCSVIAGKHGRTKAVNKDSPGRSGKESKKKSGEKKKRKEKDGDGRTKLRSKSRGAKRK